MLPAPDSQHGPYTLQPLPLRGHTGAPQVAVCTTEPLESSNPCSHHPVSHGLWSAWDSPQHQAGGHLAPPTAALLTLSTPQRMARDDGWKQKASALYSAHSRRSQQVGTAHFTRGLGVALLPDTPRLRVILISLLVRTSHRLNPVRLRRLPPQKCAVRKHPFLSNI